MLNSPTPEDADGVLWAIREVLRTSEHTLTTLEEFHYTTEMQQKRISDFLDHPDKVLIVPRVDGRIVGLMDFQPGARKRNAHQGTFGMSIHPDYQERGIGRLMLDALIEWGRANPRIETIRLQVHSQNVRGLALYRRCGFLEEGREVRAVRLAPNRYDDVLTMALDVR